MGAPDPNVYIGSVIRGRYLIEGLIGAGGFAWVLRGKTVEGRPVAVKVLHSIDADAVARFLREIEVLKALPRNPHVVEYIDDGRTVDERPFLVLELVNGKTLMQEMTRHKRRAPRDAVVFLAELCEAFIGLHQLGVAHRDVKPENVLLAKDGLIKLIDFGLIKDAQGLLRLFEEEDPIEPRRFSEEIDHRILIGTPEYMAPEQFSDAIVTDAASVKTDTWSDVFSLGVILFEMISGTVPFPFNKRTPKHKVQEAVFKYMRWRISVSDVDIPDLKEVDDALDSVMAKALRHDPRQRQPNAQTLKSDLLRYLNTGRGVRRRYDTRTVALSTKEIDEYKKRKDAEHLAASSTAVKTIEKSSEAQDDQSASGTEAPPITLTPIPTPTPSALSAPDTLLGAPPWLEQPAVFSLDEPDEDGLGEPIEDLLEQLALGTDDEEGDEFNEQESTITRTKDEPLLVVEGDVIVDDDDDDDNEATAIRRDTQTDTPSRDTDERRSAEESEIVRDRDKTSEQEAFSFEEKDPDVFDKAPTEVPGPYEDASKEKADLVIIDLPPEEKLGRRPKPDTIDTSDDKPATPDADAQEPSGGQIRANAIPVRYSDDQANTESKHEKFDDDRVATDTIPISLSDDRGVATDVEALKIPPTQVVTDDTPGSPPPMEVKSDTLAGTDEPTEKKSDTLPGTNGPTEKKSDTLPSSPPEDEAKSARVRRPSRRALKKNRTAPGPMGELPVSTADDDDEDIEDAVTAVKGPPLRRARSEGSNPSMDITNVYQQKQRKKPVDKDKGK